MQYPKNPSLVLLLAIASLLLVAAAGCAQQGGVKSLGATEIRSYQGKDLSSIGDFHENSIKGPQYVDELGYLLEINGLVKKPLSLTYAEVLVHQRYSKVVTLQCVEGWSATMLWEGVLVADLLDEAGAMPGANTVIFRSYDGYSTSLPLDYIRENHIILAYKMNNVTLPPERGFPFQLVAEDKYGYKWAKWITGMELSSDQNYKGYWESRGYNQVGNSSGPIYE
jgi:DMSO/TMAO reductase YedYZ molybdopterin-dependent catalytic subunit